MNNELSKHTQTHICTHIEMRTPFQNKNKHDLSFQILKDLLNYLKSTSCYITGFQRKRLSIPVLFPTG